MSDPETPIPVYLLAGGRSSRFGTDKARARLGAGTLLEAAAAPFSGRPLTVVADVPDKYQDLGFRTLGDREPGLGPVGGLIRAFADRAEPGWILLGACDFVGVRPEWVARLAEARTDAARAVAFRGRRWEPMFALYHTALLPAAEAALARGESALWRLLDRADALAVTPPEDWTTACSIDTPEALAAFERRSS
jgi:molybdopterin-guanine dinucleotide biosynthesis protein A